MKKQHARPISGEKNEAHDPMRRKPVEEQAGVSASGALGSAAEQAEAGNGGNGSESLPPPRVPDRNLAQRVEELVVN